MILFTVVVVSGYSLSGIIDNGPQNPETFHMVNPNTSQVWTMIGFCFYCFEGIGVVMPIYEQTRKSVNFQKMLTMSILSLILLFASFGLLCYRYFGHMEESKTFVIQNLDQNDWFVKVTRLLFCINLVFSYPLTVYPTNKILESFIFVKMLHNTPTRKWLKNLSRTIICFLGCFLSISFSNVLDKFLGVSGAVIGIPIILIIPTLCHYKLIAESRRDKILDITLILFSIITMFVCSYNGIKAWIESS